MLDIARRCDFQSACATLIYSGKDIAFLHTYGKLSFLCRPTVRTRLVGLSAFEHNLYTALPHDWRACPSPLCAHSDV